MFLQLACPRFLVPLRVTGGTYDSPPTRISPSWNRWRVLEELWVDLFVILTETGAP
jgi:hypothetical protein